MDGFCFGEQRILIQRTLAEAESQLGSGFLQGKTLLDIECLYGTSMDLLQKQGASVTGTNQSQRKVDIALDNFPIDPNKLICSEIKEYQKEHPEHKFDLVTFFLMPDRRIESLFQTMEKLMKDNGTVIIVPKSLERVAEIREIAIEAFQNVSVTPFLMNHFNLIICQNKKQVVPPHTPAAVVPTLTENGTEEDLPAPLRQRLKPTGSNSCCAIS